MLRFMAEDAPKNSSESLDEVLSDLREDAAAEELRSITVYVGRSPEHEQRIAASWLTAKSGGTGRADGPADVSREQIGHYKLIRELGRGGQAVVWLAEDLELHRMVALKLIRGLGADAAQMIQRFRREAGIASRLDHPGICSIHEVGFDEVPWIAMQLVEGETLAAKIATAKAAEDEGGSPSCFVSFGGEDTTDGSISEDSHVDDASNGSTPREMMSTVRLVEDVARALHAAHEAGVIHRDIKPANIMVTEAGNPVILDFGFAREEEGDAPTLTATGDILGTPAYMSPEQIGGQRARIDFRTDVYSLGVTLFECVTTRRPFEKPTREALYNAILAESPSDPRSLNSSVSKDLKVVIETAMARNSDDRYLTALELAEDLRRVRENRPITARPASLIKRLTHWAQRSPVVASLTATLFVGLLAGIVWTQIQNRVVDAALAERIRMSDVKRLANARDEADALWPVHPDLVPRIEAWRTKYATLFARLPEHEAALARLREKALPSVEADRPKGHASEFKENARVVGDREGNEDDRGERREKKFMEPSGGRLEGFGETVAGQSWDFGDDIDAQFMHDTFDQLVSDLRSFIDPNSGVVASVAGRLTRSLAVESRTVIDYARQWSDAIESIKTSHLYGGFILTPQMGLIPLGPDHESGFFEFLHWPSHDPEAILPRRNAQGRFEVKKETGIILVLLPGRVFLMGSQGSDPTKPNYDPAGGDDESPVHEVTLAPFFMGKHEVTGTQWSRSRGEVPVIRDPEYRPTIHWTSPIDVVDWSAADRFARQQGFMLPTEAQWEYACRAGTRTPFSSGGTLSSKEANIRDEAFARTYKNITDFERDFDDDFGFQAPVGSLAPNAFGLFDMHGNVSEWCLDWHGPYAADNFEPGTGLRRVKEALNHVCRGGSFNDTSVGIRSAFRFRTTPKYVGYDVGIRVSARVRH